MLENLTFYLILVIITVLLVMLAKKIKVAYPVLLVLAGLGISFIPGTPKIHIEPELIFFIFLPPLLYEAAWATSWKELWRWRRIVVSFAFVVVFITSLVVAFVANHFIPCHVLKKVYTFYINTKIRLQFKYNSKIYLQPPFFCNNFSIYNLPF